MRSFDEPTMRLSRRVVLPVQGLDIQGNKAAVLKRQLEGVGGVSSAFVSGRTEMIYVVFDPRRTSVEALRRVVETVGLEVGSMSREARSAG